MPEPLEGFTVVEMAIAVQGPAAALYLRDMGAEVIKIEAPMGDASRYARGRGNETPEGTIGPQFVAVNRGKRSVCLDAGTEAGMSVLHHLLENADVFLTNFREPALLKMGLSYDTLHKCYPKLVYASVNGFGPSGHDANKAMLDGVAATRAGLVNHTGYADREASLPGAVVIDTAGAMQLALGTMTALLARERYGMGQRVQTSALGTALWLQQWELTHVSMTDTVLSRDGNHHGVISGFYGIYRTQDDGAIMLAQAMDEQAWDAFCIFGEAWDLATDPRFQTPGQRFGEGLTEADSLHLRQVLRTIFANKTTAQWVAFLSTQPEIIWERARDWRQVLEDEQSIANDYFTSVEVPGIGSQKTVGNLVKLSETPGSVKGDPPVLGEANEYILSQLGYAAEQRCAIELHAAAIREAFIAELETKSST